MKRSSLRRRADPRPMKNRPIPMGETNRSPRKKVTAVVERREERDTQPSIRHCIQQTVACSCQKEICPHNGTRQHSGKNKTSMSGITEHNAPTTQTRFGMLGLKNAPSPRAAIACESSDAIRFRSSPCFQGAASPQRCVTGWPQRKQKFEFR